MKPLRVPWDIPTHTALWPEGTVFSVELHGKDAVKLPATVTMGEDGRLRTDEDLPVEFGRPGRCGVTTGVRISFDRADPTDLLVARRFLDDCLALYEPASQKRKEMKEREALYGAIYGGKRPKREGHGKHDVPIRDERSGRYA